MYCRAPTTAARETSPGNEEPASTSKVFGASGTERGAAGFTKILKPRGLAMHSFSPGIALPEHSWISGQVWNAARVLLSFPLGLIISVSFAATADAHSAPSGWLYPYQCCSGRDCQPVHGTAVKEGPEGYVVEITGEVIGYHDSRLKISPDGDFHLCMPPGSIRSRAICLFVPPRSF